MLKHSTIESVEARQPTLLACVEALISIAVYGFIAWRFQTYVHFVVAAVFAPLFLLRTKESTDWLHSLYLGAISRVFDVLYGEKNIRNLVMNFLYIMSRYVLLISFAAVCAYLTCPHAPCQ